MDNAGKEQEVGDIVSDYDSRTHRSLMAGELAMKMTLAIVGVLSLLFIAFLCYDRLGPQNEIVVDGWIMNSNIIDDNTVITIQSGRGYTPWSVTISGRYPELWQGEHVHLHLQKDRFCADNWSFDRQDFKQLP